MSSDRPASRPLKPTLASNRGARTPLTPRVAGSTTTAPSSKPTAPRAPNGGPVVSPRARPQQDTPAKAAVGYASLNITPRSSARKSRGESSSNSPAQDESPSEFRPKTVNLSPADALYGRGNGGSGLGVGVSGMAQNRVPAARPKSLLGNNKPRTDSSSTSVRSPGHADLASSPPAQDSIESRFFHASDAHRQEVPARKPELKRAPTFVYADGKEDKSRLKGEPSSPTTAVFPTEKRPTVAWIKPESQLHNARSPTVSSPALSAAASVSSFFPTMAPQPREMRSPSPSKENIHLSYRKGASQVIGTRPSPGQMPSFTEESPPRTEEMRRPSLAEVRHRTSTSMSSIDTGDSPPWHKRSNMALVNTLPLASPSTQDAVQFSLSPRIGSPPEGRPSIDTSLSSIGDTSGPLSPTKQISELAADARRERKVLDLEISNSSLLAINASLEREVRRQKTELKRFRRLSRAGRFSLAASQKSARSSTGGLSTLGEEEDEGDEDVEEDLFSLEDESDSEDDASLGSGSADARQQDRLAKDEQRLRVDLERHKELLVQSQSMNQSIKRCMYATEDMIREGNRALVYHVRVSDIKLGGRILTDHDEDDEIEVDVEDNLTDADDEMASAKGLLDVWKGLGRPKAAFEGSENGSGDRDSGIEVSEKLLNNASRTEDSSRPPESNMSRLPLTSRLTREPTSLDRRQHVP
ncbi:unnamed protein product [Zymoseptoria tritici ST99CH_1A5]|uniref:Uncharacterized protein n=1 Tax=Zymoseptoria tritici ST99CH_1A5 TaxID=1276529 RepID=A0A1Y6L4W3_ZYMTR|nr:unnamed protein product [Zymoseptoria tritici ST99CH_1A5]